MALIHFELDNLKAPQAEKSHLNGVVAKFMQDMDADKSGFFHLPVKSNFEKEFQDIREQLTHRLPEVDTFIQLGIGGSALGAETIVKALGSPTAPTFHFLDNIDPDYLYDVLLRTNPKRTLVYVVTKSGTTMETLSQFVHIYNWLERNLGKDFARNHLVFCTDPKAGDLRTLANEWKIPTFEIPASLGGRFSAHSAVGMFPALVAGIDTKQLMRGAADYRESFLQSVQKNSIHEAVTLASSLVQLYKNDARSMTVMMPYSQKLKTLSAWFTQLWAESLGKKGVGITPIAAVGPTDQHSILQLLRDGPQDKVVGFVEVQGFNHILEVDWKGPTLKSFDLVSGITMNQLMDAEFNATRQVMTNNGRPNFTLVMPRLSAHTLGQTLFAFELVTALSGYLLEIDPFDQPGVEEGKILTKERIIAAKRNLN